MSEECHRCGPVQHEAPTVLCAPCALVPEGKIPRFTFIDESRKLTRKMIQVLRQWSLK